MHAVLNHYSIQNPSTPKQNKTKGFTFMGAIICKHALVCSLRLSINELPT